jgi:hypothetical protein
MHARRTIDRSSRPRPGKVLILFAVLLPAMLAVTGLIIDGGILQGTYRRAQHVADAAATAAARELRSESSLPAGVAQTRASDRALEVAQNLNNHRGGGVRVSSPPRSGRYADVPDAVEVELGSAQTLFSGFIGDSATVELKARAVAGWRPSTAGAAIVVLDPNPPRLSVPPLPAILPALPALIGGFELEGIGTVRVDGAVLVNTEWGGYDEYGDPTGDIAPPPFGIASINLLTPRRLTARDIRVVGGVDDPDAYGAFSLGDSSPLRCGRIAVSDPLIDVPVPTTAADPVNVNATVRGGVRIIGLPIGPFQVLNPGVYDWIEIVSGRVQFNPGVYIIRGTNPITQIALNMLAGEIQAEGVMFYITDSNGYNAGSGAPDASDGGTAPPAPGVLNLLPSAVINLVLPGSRISGIDDPDSPYDGIVVFQRRRDRRPVAIVTSLLGSPGVEGTVYAKWGHVILASRGTIDASFVAGTVRIVTALPTTIAPSRLLPPAEDVFLLE